MNKNTHWLRMICGIILFLTICSVGVAELSQNSKTLTLISKAGRLVLSKEDGHIIRLTNPTGVTLVGPSTDNSLWMVAPGENVKNFGRFESGPPIGKLKRTISSSLFQSASKTFLWSWDPSRQILTLNYNNPAEPVRVRVEISPLDIGFRWKPFISVDGPQSVDFTIPNGLQFDHQSIRRFHYSNDYSIAFKPEFFQKGRNVFIRYPIAFGDMLFWTRKDGKGSVGICRSEVDRPFMPSTAFLVGGGTTPSGSHLSSSISRIYHLVARDKEWIRCPQFDIVIGLDLRTFSRRYAELRKLGSKLSEKLPKDTYEKLIRSIVLKYGSSTMAGPGAQARNDYALQREHLQRYPSPSIIHIISYLPWGFDRGYPDYLPPAATGGGPESFSELVNEIHAQGKLWMPYTNPTIWCMVPDIKERTPYQNSDDVYLRDEAGKFCYDGSTPDTSHNARLISPMHPMVRDVNKEITKEFGETWKADFMFADQTANRWGSIDYNPKTGYPPHSYVQQLVDLASELKDIVPYAMEGSVDLQVPNAVMFHTISWPMKGDPARECDYNNRFGKDTWEWSPMVMYAAHDKVIFNLHNLGDTVDTLQRLATVLALGYSIMSNAADGRCDTFAEEDPQMRWLWWLDAVQKNICARYLGQELLNFQYIDKYVIQTEYPGLNMVVNLTDASYKYAKEKVTLAPFGWYAWSDDGNLKAGHVLEAFGQRYSEATSFIWRCEEKKVILYLHADKPGTRMFPDAAGKLRSVAVPDIPQQQPIYLK